MIMTYPFDVTLVLPRIYVLYAKPCLPWAPPPSAAGSGSDAHVSVAGASDSLLLAVTGGEAVWGSVGGTVGHSPVICGCFPVQKYTHTKRLQVHKLYRKLQTYTDGDKHSQSRHKLKMTTQYINVCGQ